LTSLNTDVAEINKMVRNEIYGVHADHIDEPSFENPYPEVFVRLTPWVYGSAKNVPEEVDAIIEASDVFKSAFQSVLAEANRLFYVGMTRPQDVLILSIDEPKRGSKLLQWPICIGMDKSANSISDSGDWDVFGIGHLFKDYTLTLAELEALEPYGEKDPANSMALNIEKPLEEEKDACYLSPSKIHVMGEVLSHHSFEQRIPFGQKPSDMVVIGDCIHQIFAGMEEVRPAYQICIEEIVGSYGLSAVLADKDAIVQAWKNLTNYLTAQHGAAVKTYHERPFRLHRDGQVITGSMDFVWQTAEGDVLVDFKTCPMGASAILNPESEHYAGMYAGQLEAYTDALQAAGEKVVKRYVYYPISGLLVEI
jgi:ATP-dependent exoDNAse (exonuclease V) beta subunit